MAADEPIEGAAAPESEPVKVPTKKSVPAVKADPKPAPIPVKYATDLMVEAGGLACPECGVDLRSMSKYPGVLRCPYGHYEQPV